MRSEIEHTHWGNREELHESNDIEFDLERWGLIYDINIWYEVIDYLGKVSFAFEQFYSIGYCYFNFFNFIY